MLFMLLIMGLYDVISVSQKEEIIQNNKIGNQKDI
jgi:hypothetical protein